MSIKSTAGNIVVDQAMNYISGDPAKNLPKLLNWMERILGENIAESQLKVFHEVLENPSNVWNKFLMNLWRDVDNEVLKSTFRNLGLNATYIGFHKQQKLAKELGCNVPWAMLIDPTSACNLQCTGCWAAEYEDKLNMSYETLDSIVTQGKALGTHFYLFSGGEPLVRKKDIIRLCEAHPDCQFTAFTNGTLIDDAFGDEILRVKNFIPAISVEGFETATDFRRGIGTFKSVERAMAILKAKKIPFGISCCYTSANVEIIGSEEYFDQMIEWGAKFCWFFTYMPIGKDAVPELMVNEKQRAFMYDKVREFRRTKPIFTIDFWNDGEFSDGCLAGGKKYLHINANGDIEPCAFIHYADSNIYEHTILEALQRPLFMAYHDGQPFNENHLRPCPLLDNPDRLVDMVERSGAHSTDLQNPEGVRDLAAKCRSAAENWAEAADHIWHCSGKCAGCGPNSTFVSASKL